MSFSFINFFLGTILNIKYTEPKIDIKHCPDITIIVIQLIYVLYTLFFLSVCSLSVITFHTSLYRPILVCNSRRRILPFLLPVTFPITSLLLISHFRNSSLHISMSSSAMWFRHRIFWNIVASNLLKYCHFAELNLVWYFQFLFLSANELIKNRLAIFVYCITSASINFK